MWKSEVKDIGRSRSENYGIIELLSLKHLCLNFDGKILEINSIFFNYSEHLAKGFNGQAEDRHDKHCMPWPYMWVGIIIGYFLKNCKNHHILHNVHTDSIMWAAIFRQIVIHVLLENHYK